MDSLFDDMFTDELELDSSGARLGAADYGDDEE